MRPRDSSPRAARALRALATALLLAPTGCFSLGEDEPPAPERAYDASPALRRGERAEPRRAGALQVEPFTADAPLAQLEIAWRRGDVEAGAYRDHRWVRPPASAARDAVAEALRDAGVCEVVATEPALVEAPDWVVEGHLSRFGEVDRGARWLGVVELTLVLRDREGRERWRQTYARTRVTEQRNPLGVAVAVSEALREVAERVAQDVERVLAAAEGRDGA